VTDTAKLQKQIIRNRIAGHGVKDASPDWLPKWAAFPAKPYKAAKGCAPAGEIEARENPHQPRPMQGASARFSRLAGSRGLQIHPPLCHKPDQDWNETLQEAKDRDERRLARYNL